MLSHDDILRALVDEHQAPLTLIARVNEPLLRIPATTAALFLPDLHLITDEASRAYQGFFFHAALRTTLARTVRATNRLPELTRIQLGDRYDLWREAQKEEPRTTAELVSAIRQAHGSAVEDLTSTHWSFLAGNHDSALSKERGTNACNDADELLWLGGTNIDNDNAPVLVIHGDVFDLTEQLFPAWFKRSILHGPGASAHESTKALSRDPTTIIQQLADGPIDRNRFHAQPLPAYAIKHPALPLVRNDADVHQAAPLRTFNTYYFPSPHYYVLDTGGSDVRFLKAARTRSKAMAATLGYPAPKLTVIGHTHDPRLIVSTREDGKTPFVLMDCGAWVEASTYPQDGHIVTTHSAHIGVLVGCDARLYQLPAG